MTDDAHIHETVLVSRVIDRAERCDDWDALELLGTDDPGLWRRLALGLRDDCELREGVAALVAQADRVELPAMSGGARGADDPDDGPRAARLGATPHGADVASDQPGRVDRRERASAAMGWAAALFLGLAWWLHAGSERATPAPVVRSDATPPAPTLVDASRAAPRLDGLDDMPGLGGLPRRVDDGADGRLVVEFPKVLLETRPLPDGGVEVLYIRRSVEREVVNGAWALTEDDLGRLQPVPVDLAALTPSELL